MKWPKCFYRAAKCATIGYKIVPDVFIRTFFRCAATTVFAEFHYYFGMQTDVFRSVFFFFGKEDLI